MTITPDSARVGCGRVEIRLCFSDAPRSSEAETPASKCYSKAQLGYYHLLRSADYRVVIAHA